MFGFVPVASTQQHNDILIPTYPREHLMPQKFGVVRDVFPYDFGFVSSYVIALFIFFLSLITQHNTPHIYTYFLLKQKRGRPN